MQGKTSQDKAEQGRKQWWWKQPSRPIASTARTHMAQAPAAAELLVDACGGVKPMTSRLRADSRRTFPGRCACDRDLHCDLPLFRPL
jgi:hypothetical protein